MSVKIIQPGALTTVQDLGRFGYQESGMQPCGVMDQRSYEIANTLVGNYSGEAVLELSYSVAAISSILPASWR